MPTDDEQQAPAAAAAGSSSSRQPQQQQGGDEDDDGRVPIVDLTPLREGGAAGKAAVAAAIKRACETVGFFIITAHGVPQEVIDTAWERARAFFDLPAGTKAASVPMDGSSYPYGYCGMGGEVLSKGKAYETASSSSGDDGGGDKEQAGGAGGSGSGGPDLKESFSVGPYDPRSGMPPPRWPPADPSNGGVAGFAEALTAYYQAMESLAAQLMEAFALALDLPPSWFTEKMAGHCSALRVLNYPNLENSPPPAPGQLRASAHTDYGVLTILRQDEPGLQVQTRKGAWCDVPLLPGAYVINLGDLMARWTNDRWKSTPHRVICPSSPSPAPAPASGVDAGKGDSSSSSGGQEPGGKEGNRRQSMAYFCNLPPGVTVACIETCTGPGDPPRYPPINAMDFLLSKHKAATGGGGDEGEQGTS